MSVLDNKIVLVLNANWVPIRTCTVQDAFLRMSRAESRAFKAKRPYCALDIDFERNLGVVDFANPTSIIPIDWAEWIKLPIRSFDKFISTSKTRIRIPSIIIANNYKKIPEKKIKYTKSSIWKRDDFTCKVTNTKLTQATGSIDHWVPSSKGGKTDFENCILVSKQVNAKKGDMTMEDFCKKYQHSLPERPKSPNLDKSVIYNTFNIPEWDIFLNKK